MQKLIKNHCKPCQYILLAIVHPERHPLHEIDIKNSDSLFK